MTEPNDHTFLVDALLEGLSDPDNDQRDNAIAELIKFPSRLLWLLSDAVDARIAPFAEASRTIATVSEQDRKIHDRLATLGAMITDVLVGDN